MNYIYKYQILSYIFIARKSARTELVTFINVHSLMNTVLINHLISLKIYKTKTNEIKTIEVI